MKKDSILIQTNKFQTPIGKELKDNLPPKVYEQLLDFINTVPLVKHLISPDTVRGYARDQGRPTNDDGSFIYKDNRIKVNVVAPHILEDMDFFRERALFYEANGRYTNITPNPNPKSDYAAFWKQELKRWKYGLVRESDGEWIPGQLYFYWNYSPIWLVEVKSEKTSSDRQQGERVRKFPKPWLGDYLYFHYIDQARKNGQHGKLLKTRGIGFSFKMGAVSPCNMYIYPGSGNPNFHLASEKTFLAGDKGLFGKVIDVLDWIADTTPLPRIRLINSARSMEIQLGYQDKYGNRKGLLSTVYGISLKDAPQKARGIRGPLIHYEEDGLFPNLEEAWGVNRRAVESGGVSFGFMLAGGTGGTEGASFEGSKKLFYKPGAYNIYSVPNMYDRNVNGHEQCGFFWGCYMNRENCYEEQNGEPDVVKALVEILLNRYQISQNSKDPAALTQAKAEEPITPQEAIMKTTGTLFPVGDLSEYLNTIIPVERQFLAQHYTGDLVYDPVKGVKFQPNADKVPIRTLDVDKKQREGCIEIFELPKMGRDGKPMAGRYIAGVDPIDADEGNSLFSILVMDLLADRIVAEYTGRYAKAEYAYEEALKLCIYYNAQANYENNLKGMYAFFKHKNALHYLADTPEILKDMDFIKPSINAAKGTRATAPVNAWGRQLQVSWMLSKAYNTEDLKEEEEDEKTVLNLHKLRGLGYIEECIAWNPDGNFDRVSAAGMLFILREERVRRIGELRKKGTKTKNKWTNSSFFKQNFEYKNPHMKQRENRVQFENRDKK